MSTAEDRADLPGGATAPTSPATSTSGLPRTSSTTIKLNPGEIPSTWAKPAEVVSTIPSRARRPFPVLAILAAGVVACLLGIAISLPRQRALPAPLVVDPPSATATTASATSTVPSVPSVPPVDEPKPASAIPAPPPTASTTPAAVAPEDQGMEPSATTPTPSAAATAPSRATPASATVPPASATPATPSATSTTPSATSTTSSATSTTPSATSSQPGVDISLPLPGELPARKKARALTTRAIVQLRDGDFSGAEPSLVRAVLIDPSFADAWRHLGIARAQLGDRDGARRAYKKYLELAPHAPDADQVRAILAQ